ncbi:MAG: hypothetical protein WAL67_17535 [Candidatus Cybelea sp.]|jgi:hypothetical protein
MDQQDDRRKEVEDADDTGMVADEQFINTALLREQLHAALPEGHAAHPTVEQLHSEIKASAPNARAIEHHVGALRAFPELEAIVANWWDDPRTQRFIAGLGQIGL